MIKNGRFGDCLDKQSVFQHLCSLLANSRQSSLVPQAFGDTHRGPQGYIVNHCHLRVEPNFEWCKNPT